MLARLPAVRAKELVAALEQAGFQVIRQRGSHATLHNPGTDQTVVVPVHTGEFPRWLLKKIIKDAGLNEQQFRLML
jgi:predicted RNA binding protein YcfA (HicA-like mRNA interferase family)